MNELEGINIPGHVNANADPKGVARLRPVGFCRSCAGVLHQTEEKDQEGRFICVCDGCGSEYARLEEGQRPKADRFYVADQIDWEWARKNTVRKK